MSAPFGVVLVTHKDPEQTLFLCQRLSHIFGDLPIAIHHDFSQHPLDLSVFPSNVRFVRDWNRTGWGVIGVVDALLSALGLLYARKDSWGDPDWFVSLSSADYPIQTADTILSQLRESSWDAYLDSREIHAVPGAFVNEPLGEFPFQQPRYHQFAFNRYVAVPMLSVKQARRFKVPVERFCFRSPWMIKRFTPFGQDLRCFAGDAWMTARRRVAELLLARTPLWEKLHEHYRTRCVPEESIYHTLLGNTPGFAVNSDNLRYTDWKGCFAHPRTLQREDFPRLLASTQHFARKFAFEPALLNELDLAVEQAAAQRFAEYRGHRA